MGTINHNTKDRSTLVPEFSAPDQPELEVALNTLAKGVNKLYQTLPVPQSSSTIALTKANDGVNFSFDIIPEQNRVFVGRFELHFSFADQTLYINTGSVAFINAACEVGSPGEILSHTDQYGNFRKQNQNVYAAIDKDGCPVWGNDIEPIFPTLVTEAESAADGKAVEGVAVDEEGAGWIISQLVNAQATKDFRIWVKAWTSRKDKDGNELTGGTDNINQIKAGADRAQVWIIDATKDPSEVADSGENEVGYGCQFFLIGKVTFKETELPANHPHLIANDKNENHFKEEADKIRNTRDDHPYTLESLEQYWMSDITIVKYRVENEVDGGEKGSDHALDDPIDPDNTYDPS
tara:strand:+ start:22655 stop:23704 length:1050 start_codon:yes stop_codon:yes gene_type:complete